MPFLNVSIQKFISTYLGTLLELFNRFKVFHFVLNLVTSIQITNNLSICSICKVSLLQSILVKKIKDVPDKCQILNCRMAGRWGLQQKCEKPV